MTEDERQLLLVAALRGLVTIMALGLPPYVVVVSYLTSWWAILFMPPVLLCSWALWVLRDNLP